MANEADYPAKYQLEDGSGSILLETGTDYLIKELQDYADLVVSDGAFLYFRLNEASGNFTDIVGGLTGTATGSAMTYAQTGALVGDSDTSVQMTANDQYISVPGSTALSPAGHSNSMTLECWVNPTLNGQFNDIAQLNSGNDWDLSLQINNSTSTLTSTAANNLGGDLLGGSLSLSGRGSLNNWFYVAMVWDGGATAITLYLNSTTSGPVSGWTGTPKVWASGVLAIGSATGGSAGVRGRLDEFALYPTALTADQVARHYYCGLQYLPIIPPPVQLAAH